MPAIATSVQKRIVDFVHYRVQCIRSGDRARIDGTYNNLCLKARNEYSRHDYDWYMHLIETGFGADVREIRVTPASPPLPFSGMVTYPWPRETYRVLLTTVTDRTTMWLVGIEEGQPSVALPSFNGRVADSIAVGEIVPWKESQNPEADPESSTVVVFYPDYFSERLADRVAFELDFWANRWKFETFRAIALDCHPWHGGIGLCLLTTYEEFPEEKYGKWALGGWRLQNFTSSTGADGWPAARELERLMNQYYEGKTATDTNQELTQRADTVFRCCARALLSERVAAALKHYMLSDDFEAGVFDPDHPGTNYCALV